MRKTYATILGVVTAGTLSWLAHKFLFPSKKTNTMSNGTTTSSNNTSNLPRGYRNNNPVNIRISATNNWLGKVQNNTDGVFEQFVAMRYGYRAAFVLIRNYVNNYGLNTVEGIISRFAPNTENNTSGYINSVCKQTGFKATTLINPYNRDQMTRLMFAMATVENGMQPIPTDISAGWDLYIG